MVYDLKNENKNKNCYNLMFLVLKNENKNKNCFNLMFLVKLVPLLNGNTMVNGMHSSVKNYQVLIDELWFKPEEILILN